MFKFFKNKINKVIYYKEYTSPSRWGACIKSYIKIERRFSMAEGKYYSITIPNAVYSHKKLIFALLRAIEHESILASKYNSLKEEVYYNKNTPKIIGLFEEVKNNEKD